MEIDLRTTRPRDIIAAATDASQKAANDASQAQAAAALAEASKGARAEFAMKGIGVEDNVILFIGGSVNEDADGDAVTQDALRQMSYDFCSRGERVFKGNHQDELPIELVESWAGAPIIRGVDGTLRILAKGEKLPDLKTEPIVGINIEKGMATHYFLGGRTQDAELLAEAARGELTASWAGYVKRTEG